MPEENEPKPKMFRLSPPDLARLAFIRQRTGIGNDTDAVRYALADVADRLGYQQAQPGQDYQPTELDKR